MNIFEGHKVVLRSVMVGDAERFFRDSVDSHAQRFGDETKLPFPISNLVERLEQQKDRTSDKVWLAIVDKATGDLVGSTNVHDASRRHGTFEYGIGVFAEYRRNGFAGEAIRLLLRYYFRELGYNKALATVYAFNRGSIAMHRSLGFIEEGRLRQSLYTDGGYHDEFIFGLLAKEFEAQENRLPAFTLGPPE